MKAVATLRKQLNSEKVRDTEQLSPVTLDELETMRFWPSVTVRQ